MNAYTDSLSKNALYAASGVQKSVLSRGEAFFAGRGAENESVLQFPSGIFIRLIFGPITV